MSQTVDSINKNQDWFLENLVNTVNNSDIEIGITLQMDGFLVSGHIVNGRKYFDGFSQEFISETAVGFGNKEALETLRQGFDKYASLYDKQDDSEDFGASFIHLEGARFFNTNGAPIPNNRGMWWRGRISEVSGFILGTLNAKVVED